ncbi:MAG: TonB-dependent receptor [Gammaproteobacteria bacterium]|nr:TonB-dependent receptor [Gammaproteobacteria bacterium]
MSQHCEGRSFGKLTLGIAGLVFLLIWNTSFAANPIEEIVVTALKRDSTLQDTPIAISALTSQKLERIGADDFADFVGSVPGLTIRDNGPGSSRPIIRGIASPGEPQVGVYFDDALVIGAPGTTNDAGIRSPELKPFDLQRVEVLKGPQGTLYGGGSMGGTLRFITNKPNAEEFEGKISVEGSSVRYGDEGYQFNGMVNLPIIKDQLALRVVAFKRDDPGFIDNVAVGKKDINDVDTEGGRAILRWTPTDRLTLTGSVYYQDQNVGGGFHYNPSIDKDNPQTDVLSNEPYNDEQVLYNFKVEYSLDWAEAMYSGSWFDRNAVYRFHNGFTGIPFPPVLSTQPEPLQAVSHEFRLSSSGDNVVDWTVGLFYSDRNAYVDSRVQYPGADGNVADDTVFLFRRTVNSSLLQKAVYGEATWHVNDRLALTAGVRYYDVESGSEVVNKVNIPGIGLPSGTPGRNLPFQRNVTRGSDDGAIFKAHIGYDVSDDMLVYASFSQGFRPGGANQNTSSIALTDPGNAGVPEAFKSDSLDSYEIGIRSQWLDRRLTLNAAVYYIDWEDIVLGGRSATGLFGFLLNADSAEATGFELESVFDLADDFRVTAALSYVDAQLTANAPPNRQRTGGVTYSRSGLDGDSIPDVADWTFNASAEYGHQLAWMGGLRGFVYLNLNYTGESAADFNPVLLDINTFAPTTVPNVSYNKQGDYAIVDMRIGVEADDWSASLFLDNVFDERGSSHIFEDGTFRIDPGLNFIERPRTFGIVFDKEF